MFDPGYFDPSYFQSLLGAGGYFDCDYFDQAYFDTGDCGDVTPTGRGGGRRITTFVQTIDDAEELFALI